MEVADLDDTSQKIIDAAMHCIREKGYAATTTREIAGRAGVNECTLFRKFKSKKEIILQGVSQAEWRANITPDAFSQVEWDLQTDLEMFLRTYMDRMTADFVKLSIGLRAPQIYEETAPHIMKVPQVFLTALTDYLSRYTFLNASFGKKLTDVEKEDYIKNSVQVLINGIMHG